MRAALAGLSGLLPSDLSGAAREAMWRPRPARREEDAAVPEYGDDA